MINIVPVKNALLSVYHKDGIVDMAATLHSAGVGLYSSGGTARAINAAGLPVTDVADYAGFPPLFGHRVVTLHPKIHGGILYRRGHQGDEAERAEHSIVGIDLVVGNLYPVQDAITTGDIAEVIEKTDIGGPTLIRGAAKNHKHVGVVVDPRDYGPVANQIQDYGGLDDRTRLELATKVFMLMSEYDGAIAEFLKRELRGSD